MRFFYCPFLSLFPTHFTRSTSSSCSPSHSFPFFLSFFPLFQPAFHDLTFFLPHPLLFPSLLVPFFTLLLSPLLHHPPIPPQPLFSPTYLLSPHSHSLSCLPPSSLSFYPFLAKFLPLSLIPLAKIPTQLFITT